MKYKDNDPWSVTQQPQHNRGAPSNQRQQVASHKKGPKRIEKHPLDPSRIRKIKGSFAFVEHRFLSGGFWSSLDPEQLLLYLFLILVADRNGISYYSYDKICTLVGLTLDEYIEARNTLIAKDLIAFNGTLFQVLSLPEKAVSPSAARGQTSEIHQLLR